MLKYAVIVDNNTKLCNVGLGTNIAFYKKIGMTETDVEQATDGRWYLKGYAPEIDPVPTAPTLEERVQALEAENESMNDMILGLVEVIDNM